MFLFHSFTCSCPVFPEPLIEEAVFSPLYILASFIKNKVTICAWVYLWAFYPVPLIYISVFVAVPYCLDDCSFVVESWMDLENSVLSEISPKEKDKYYRISLICGI